MSPLTQLIFSIFLCCFCCFLFCFSFSLNAIQKWFDLNVQWSWNISYAKRTTKANAISERATSITILNIWYIQIKRMKMFVWLFLGSVEEKSTLLQRKPVYLNEKFKWQRTQVENSKKNRIVSLRKRLLPFGFHRHFDIV